VRHHFHFEAKRKQIFRFSAKKVLFRLFRIDAKCRNLKRNENGTKRKQNEKEAKKLLSFSLRSKLKQRAAIIFASKRNGSEKLP
jgi:hypothetical protein